MTYMIFERMRQNQFLFISIIQNKYMHEKSFIVYNKIVLFYLFKNKVVCQNCYL